MDAIAPVSVAALGNGIESVIVVDAVSEQSNDARESIIVNGVDHGHGVIPVSERGHDQGTRPRPRKT